MGREGWGRRGRGRRRERVVGGDKGGGNDQLRLTMEGWVCNGL